MSNIRREFDDLLCSVWRMRQNRERHARGKEVVIYMSRSFYQEALSLAKPDYTSEAHAFVRHGTIFGYRVHAVVDYNPSVQHNRWEAFYK